MPGNFSILQTCVPPYRRLLFDKLSEQLGASFHVVAGDRYFNPEIVTDVGDAGWYRHCHNVFLARNQLVWQRGEALKSLLAGPFVVEGNPRCLRTWSLLLKARSHGIPTAIWAHALGRQVGATDMGLARRLMFACASTIICYGYDEQELLRWRFPAKRLLVAGNSSVSSQECTPLSTSPMVRSDVLFMGRLTAAKKPLLLLQALEILQKQGASIGAIIIGDGPESAGCREFVARSRLSGIVFGGSCFHRPKIRELASSAFCMASPGYVGLSVLDALSMGLPVAYCRNEPNAPEVEVLQDGANAITFEKGSAVSLAAALKQLHAEREEWLKQGARSARIVSDRYSVENMAHQFVSFFRSTN